MKTRIGNPRSAASSSKSSGSPFPAPLELGEAGSFLARTDAVRGWGKRGFPSWRSNSFHRSENTQERTPAWLPRSFLERKVRWTGGEVEGGGKERTASANRERRQEGGQRAISGGGEGRKRGVDDKEEIADKSRMKEQQQQQQGESGVGSTE